DALPIWAHVVEDVVVGDVAGRDQLDAGFLEPARLELLHQAGADPGRNEHEQRIRLGVTDALEEGGEIGVLQRRPQRFHHRATAGLEGLLEPRFGIQAGGIVGDQRHHPLETVGGGPFAHRAATWGSVKLERTMYGDFSVMLDVAAAITTIGVLLCVATGAAEKASGVSPNPASTCTRSRTTSSWARRRLE